jgi:ABC-type oligopeptide transport system substrate-binding subunit
LLPIRGARALREGEASELEGLRILSATELLIELEEPLAFFPALLTHPGVSIVPEGCRDFRGSWQKGCSGTGPFRVLRFEPGERLDLGRNPHYWRAGFPKSERLSFHFGIPTERLADELRSGRLSLVSDLPPTEVVALHRDPDFVGGYQEAPRLSTYFLTFNCKRGPFADPVLRRHLASHLDVDTALDQALGSLVIRARGLIPPGLLGHEIPPRAQRAATESAAHVLRGNTIEVAVLTAYRRQYGAFWDRLGAGLRRLGLEVRVTETTPHEMFDRIERGEVDLAANRWIADYPDPDTFVSGLFQSDTGFLRNLASSPELDRLCAQGRRLDDTAQRHAIYRQTEELLARETWIVPLFHEQVYRFCHPSVRGLRLNLTVPDVRYEELSTA